MNASTPSNPSPPPPPTGPSGTGAPGAPQRSFFARLFDTSFSEFITPSIIKVLFILGIVFSAIMGLFVLIALASQGGVGILMGLIGGPLIFVVYVLLMRVTLEIYLVLFQIERNTRK